MNFNDFYSRFEEKYKDDLIDVEKIRLKTFHSYRSNTLLRILIPLIIFAILTILLKELMIILLFYMPIFAIFTPFVFKNKYLTIIPLLFLLIAGIILTGIFHFKGIVVFYIVIVTAILLEIAMLVKLFLNHKEQWNKKFIKSTEVLKLKYTIVKTFWKINSDKNIISKQDLRNSDLFISFNSIEVDDEFRGLYKNTPFYISETRLFNAKKDDNHEDNIFKGVIVNFKINKNVKNRTIVTTKRNKISINNPAINFFIILLIICSMYFGFKYTPLAFILCLLLFYPLIVKKEKNPQEYKEFQKVVLEDPKFNKIFNVYSSDQTEARYLLTTSFMERFKDLQQVFGAKVVKCSFYDKNKLMIAISTDKNLFEIGSLFKSVYDKDFLKQFYRELSSIYFLMDYFKLDEKTGL